MKIDDAQILAKKLVDKYQRVHITSDGSIYLNGDIEAIEAHAKDNNLQLFHIKPELVIEKSESKKTKK